MLSPMINLWNNLDLSFGNASDYQKLSTPTSLATANVKSGGLNKLGLAAGILAGVGSLATDFLSTHMSNEAYAAQASAYRTNARMAITAAEQQNRYLNEQNAQQVWNIFQNARELQGAQRVTMAASGFTDVSAGDQRIIDDTRYRAERAASGVNRSTYLQSFENMRQARMEAARLEYAAQMADISKEYNSNALSWTSRGLGALGSALGAYSAFSSSGGSGGNINVFGQFF